MLASTFYHMFNVETSLTAHQILRARMDSSCISNFMKFSRHQIFRDLDSHNAHLFSRRSPFFQEIFTTLTIFMTFRSENCDYFQDAVSQIYEISRRFHDFFTMFAASSVGSMHVNKYTCTCFLLSILLHYYYVDRSHPARVPVSE